MFLYLWWAGLSWPTVLEDTGNRVFNKFHCVSWGILGLIFQSHVKVIREAKPTAQQMELKYHADEK